MDTEVKFCYAVYNKRSIKVVNIDRRKTKEGLMGENIYRIFDGVWNLSLVGGYCVLPDTTGAGGPARTQ